MMNDAVTNDSVDAILSMVPATLHKYLTPHTRNHTVGTAGTVPDQADAYQLNNLLIFYLSLTALLVNASNLAGSGNGVSSATTISFEVYRPPNITEIKRQIIRYNEMQLVLNEDAFGPLQNDSVIIVVQVSGKLIREPIHQFYSRSRRCIRESTICVI